MRQAVKQLIKAVLPKPALLAVLDARDAMRLAVTPRRDFSRASALHRGPVNLEAVFRNPEAERTWHADHAAIKELFGEDDKSGGINPGDRRALYYLTRALAPENILEVGTHIGASTLYLARALAANGKGRITTVDILN